MEIKTSVAISEEVLAAIDEIAAKPGHRSRIIEQALVEFVERRRRGARDARDLRIINRHAGGLSTTPWVSRSAAASPLQTA